MSRRYRLSRKGKIIGEFPFAELKSMRDHGLLQPDDHVWGAGMTDWQNAIKFLAMPEAPESPPSAEKDHGKMAVLAAIWISAAFILIMAIFLVAYFMASTAKPGTAEPNIALSTIPTTAQSAPTPAPAPQPAAPKPMMAERSKQTGVTKDYTFTGFGFDGKELFGSSVLAYASVKPTESSEDDHEPDEADGYGEGFASAAIAIGGARKGDRFSISISGDRFIKHSKLDFVVEEDADYVTASPSMVYDYEALSKLRQSTPFNVTYTIQRQGEAPRTQSDTWIAHQINDCQTASANYYLTKGGVIKPAPLASTFSFAGYVNENHPWIDGLLNEAIQTKLCDGFYGYQLGTKAVGQQVNAVWTALQRRGIRYSNIASSTSSDDNRFQHVRFIDETITSSQANCVDGTVVFASILKKIGLNVSIILVPNHAYVAVRDEKNERFLYAIETTMLASGTLAAAIFEASNKGEHALNKIASKLEDENEQDFVEINIQVAREVGINPIPYVR
jgi:hypothetical protein